MTQPHYNGTQAQAANQNQLLNNTAVFENLLGRSLTFQDKVLSRILNYQNNLLNNQIQLLQIQEQAQ